jgi:prophage regulatory protein
VAREVAQDGTVSANAQVLIRQLAIPHATVYGLIHDGLFPVPVPIGQRAVGFPDHEVRAINTARIRGDSDDQIRALVNKLHSARMAGSDEPFKTDWFDRSAMLKKQAAAKKSKRTTA